MNYIIVSEIINSLSNTKRLRYRDYFDCDGWIPRTAILDIVGIEDHNFKIILSSTFVKGLEIGSKNPHNKHRFHAQYLLNELLNKTLEELKKIEAAQPKPPENTALP